MADEGNKNDHQLEKSSSVKSVDSTLTFESDDLNDDKTYNMAPWDIFGDAAGVGRVKVAKVGDILPLTTGYKVKKDGTAQVGVKFRISEFLGVEVFKVKNLSPAEMEKINGSIPSSEAKKAAVVNEELKNIRVEEKTNKQPEEETTATTIPPEVVIVPGGSFTKSKQEWLSDFNSNFTGIVVGGMEASMRKTVADSIHEKKALKGKANQAVINSVNHHIYEYIGNQRPTKEFCRDVAEMIKRCIPDTYAMVETMESDQFGSLPVKKAKGEGGLSDLSTRIGNNYYNDYLRGCCASKSVTDGAAPGRVKRLKRDSNVVKQPVVKLEMCEYEKIRMNSINEQREMLLKLGFLKPKEKKVKQKRKLKLICDQVAPVRRSARLCIKH